MNLFLGLRGRQEQVADVKALDNWGMGVQQEILMRPPDLRTPAAKEIATKFLRGFDSLLREYRESTLKLNDPVG